MSINEFLCVMISLLLFKISFSSTELSYQAIIKIDPAIVDLIKNKKTCTMKSWIRGHKYLNHWKKKIDKSKTPNEKYPWFLRNCAKVKKTHKVLLVEMDSCFVRLLITPKDWNSEKISFLFSHGLHISHLVKESTFYFNINIIPVKEYSKKWKILKELQNKRIISDDILRKNFFKQYEKLYEFLKIETMKKLKYNIASMESIVIDLCE